MITPSRWRIGLLPLFLVGAATLFLGMKPIERDVDQRARTSLEQHHNVVEGQIWPTLNVRGRDVRMGGEAPTPAESTVALGVVEDTWSVRRVSDGGVSVTPVAAPFTWRASVAGDRVELSGSVPRDGSRQTLMAAARAAMPQAVVSDVATAGRGAPAGFDKAGAYVLGLLSKLERGEGSIVDNTVTLSGAARDQAAFAAARAALASAPSGFTVKADITPPPLTPYVTTMEKTGPAVRLTGALPSAAAQADALKAVAAAMPGVAVTNSTTLWSGAPAGFDKAGAYAIGILSQFDRGEARIVDNTVTVSGVARDQAAFTAARAALASPPAGFTVKADITPPPLTPYVTTLEKTGPTARLAGAMPSAAAQGDALKAAAAAMPGVAVTNSTALWSGAPAKLDPIAAAAFMGKIAADLRNGTVELRDGVLSVKGEALNYQSLTSAVAMVGDALPAGVTKGAINITPPPFAWGANRGDGSLTLTGSVPDEAAREKIVAASKRLFQGDKVNDRMTLGPVPDGFGDSVRVTLGLLSRLAIGKVTMTDKTVTVEGNAYYDKAAERISAALSQGAGLPAGWKPSWAVSTVPAAVKLGAKDCGAALQQVLARGTIYFETGRANLDADATGFLDDIAATALRCPDASFTISGHTDSVGAADANMTLSRQRAEAVSAWLADAGIDRGRLFAEGFGEDRPVADNNTEDGRARNRRIEIHVREP